jgi:hypothetical protein
MAMGERMTDPTCQEIVELVTEYPDGAMRPESIDQFEQHVVFCQGCDAYLDQMRRSIVLLRHVGDDGVDIVALDQLMAAFRSRRS